MIRQHYFNNFTKNCIVCDRITLLSRWTKIHDRAINVKLLGPGKLA